MEASSGERLRGKGWHGVLCRLNKVLCFTFLPLLETHQNLVQFVECLSWILYHNNISLCVIIREMSTVCLWSLLYCRKYVEKELSFEIGHLPEKHDLSYYPTVHDLQNHIHKALQDIKDGTLPFTSDAVSVILGLLQTGIKVLANGQQCILL